VGERAGLRRERGVALVQPEQGIEVPAVDAVDDRREHLLGGGRRGGVLRGGHDVLLPV
jgi:hypothetical protein